MHSVCKPIQILPLLSFFVCLLVSCISTQDSQSVEVKVDHYLHSFPEPFNGSILVAVGDNILIRKGYGLANREFNIPNDGDTKFSIGSITKHFTDMLVLQMVEKGVIDLDATVSDYLPFYPPESGRRITIQHLLTHRSGIPHHYQAIPAYFEKEDKHFHTPKEYLELFWNADLAHEPGQGFTYTSPGYFLLGVILETVTNKSYAELLTENILQPLAMNNTFVGNNRTVHLKMATGYMKGLEGLVLADVEQESNRLAAGALVTTPEDLFKFLRILNHKSDKILSRESKEMFYRPITNIEAPIKDRENPLKVFRTGGSSYGFQANMDRWISEDVCIIVLSNIQSSHPSTLMILDRIGDFLLEELEMELDRPSRPEEPVPVDSSGVAPSAFHAYEGFYELQDKGFIDVVREGDCLYTDYFSGDVLRGVERKQLIPIEAGLFLLEKSRGLQYQFPLDSNSAFAIEILRNGQLQSRAELVKPVDSELAEYAGYYYSVELQKTYSLTAEDEGLALHQFLGHEAVLLTPLERDLFGCRKGYLIFNRGEGGEIRDFTLKNSDLDSGFGAIFIKR